MTELREQMAGLKTHLEARGGLVRPIIIPTEANPMTGAPTSTEVFTGETMLQKYAGIAMGALIAQMGITSPEHLPALTARGVDAIANTAFDMAGAMLRAEANFK